MRSVPLLLSAALVTSSACAPHYTRPAVAVGTAATVLGALLLATNEPTPPSTEWDSHDIDVGYALQDLAGKGALAAGLLLILAGVIPSANGDPSSPDEVAETAPPPDSGLDRLTLRAVDAARAGDCMQVMSLAGQVRAADATYYRITFASDPLLARCLR